MGAALSFCAGAFLLLFPYAWCALRGEDARDYGLFWDYNARDFVFALGVCAAVLVPLTAVAMAWPWEDLPRYSDLPRTLRLGISGLAAAIIEETFFRGWLQTLLARRFSPAVAIVLVNLAFAPIHLIVAPNWVSLCTFFPGLVMGWLKYRCGNLFAPALFHFVGNIWAIWFFPMPVNF